MPKTSTAEANNYICPKCKEPLAQDHEGRGFVRHLNKPDCDFEEGQRDDPISSNPVGGDQETAEQSVAPDRGGI